MNIRKQFLILILFVAIFALLAFIAYIAVPMEQLTGGQPMPPGLAAFPRWQLGLAEAVFVFIVYGLLGALGLWFVRHLGSPGMIRPGLSWREAFWLPMGIGGGLGAGFVIVDQILAALDHRVGFPHPDFPFSIIASATAGIGEEILFRGFVLGLWAFLFNLGLRRWSATHVALGIGNLIAAFAASAAHLPAALLLFNVTSPADLPPAVVLELFALNGLLGWVAGARSLRDGLVTAVGIHFGADVVWHVLWPLVG